MIVLTTLYRLLATPTLKVVTPTKDGINKNITCTCHYNENNKISIKSDYSNYNICHNFNSQCATWHSI